MKPNLALLLLTAAGACTSAEAVVARNVVKPPPAGTVVLSEGSLPFVKVEEVKAQGGGTALRAPARAAFKDGALSQLGAPLAGRVIAVHVRSGDKVEKGQALVSLDCPEAASMRTGLVTVSASLKEARAALEREKRMQEQGVGIERERLAAETRVAELEAELQRAKAASTFVGTGQDTTVVLRAPLSGVVISRRATVGAAVQAGGDPLVEIGDPAALWVVADVFERDLTQVHEGAEAKVELASFDEPLSGRVASIGAVVVGGMRTAPVRIELSEGATSLRPGMFGRAQILTPSQGLALPVEAVLIEDGKDTVVYVETGPRTFERRTVVIGPPREGFVGVSSGLKAGDRVVVHGALLVDGAAEQLL